MELQIKYFTDEVQLKMLSIGDWIDVKSAIDIQYKEGDFILLPLGFALKLPDGYEALLVPRSSTFRKYGVIQTNGMGVIDNSYSGDTDQWMVPFLAMRDGHIEKGDRVAQFRVLKNQDPISFERVSHLGTSRGGFGSTGVK